MEHPDPLLPWYVNETLSPAERADVEGHLRLCARCRAEVAWLRSLREHMQRLDRADVPSAFGRARVLRDIERQPRRRWLPVALAAAIALAALPPILLVDRFGSDVPIVPLGEKRSDGGVLLQIRFVPTASEAQIRRALRDVGATLIDGPSAIGVYRARLTAVRPVDAAEIENAVERLRAQTPIVEHVVRE